MKARVNPKGSRKYYVILVICIIVQLLMSLIKERPEWVETYYSRGVYPGVSYLYVILFSWIPFSIGDVFYFLVTGFTLLLAVRIIRSLWKRSWLEGRRCILELLTLLSLLYTVFYVNWGLNYYREPISKHLKLQVKETHAYDYVDILGKYIIMANQLREQLDINSQPRQGVKMDLEAYVRKDTIFRPLFSKTQVHAKEPLSSKLISYFTVSGYFNPFTMEVQVNQEILNSSYPFVYVHELAHQMGIGFEDECNFIAFRLLVDHENKWYRYTAYYAAIQSLLRPLYGDKEQLERVRSLLSDKVLADFKAERDFWISKQGWLDEISGLFYNQYLQHNNQPEGLARYDMMAQLIVAWETQQRHDTPPANL